MSSIKKIILKIINLFGYDLSVKQAEPSFHHDPDYENYKPLLDIPGFLSFNAFKLFRNLEKISSQSSTANFNVLEIGVYCGQSLLGLGTIYKNRTITGVDPFYNSFEDSPAFTDEAEFLKTTAQNQTGDGRLQRLMKKIEVLGLQDTVTVQRMTQEAFLENEETKKYQLIYLDGEHTYKSVMFFLDKMDTILAADGFLVIDDFLSFGFPGISEAVHTHSSYKKNLYPICYAFNKGVFLYKPSKTYLEKATTTIQEFIIKNKFKSHQSDNDSSLIILE